MPLPEGYLPRKGDLVAVQGTVKWDCEVRDPYVHITVAGRSLSIEPEYVTLVRRHWLKDDRVMTIGSFWPQPGIVIAVAEDFVWVKDPSSGEPITYPANSLKEWVDRKAPLQIDEDAVLAMKETAVAEAMAEPDTVAEITVVEPPPPAPSLPEGLPWCDACGAYHKEGSHFEDEADSI